MSNEGQNINQYNSIRRQFDEKSGRLYFSIVDVIAIVSDSSDSRNYWKVLKNRLKKGEKELVTKCNQLKMISSDGKSYLTDVADGDTILDIIKIVSPSEVTSFRLWFEEIESNLNLDKKISTDESEDVAELTIDAYQTDDLIIIESMVAGVLIDNLSISVNYNEVTIRGKRMLPEKIPDENYSLKELYWGDFSRNIPLPEEVDIDGAEATISHGLLEIKLPKINKLRTRKIKIKSLD